MPQDGEGHPQHAPASIQDHPRPLIQVWRRHRAPGPGALRSDHPQVSFAVIEPLRSQVTAGHHLQLRLGDRSLGAVNRLDGKVFLLASVAADASLHLAEWRQPNPPCHITGSAILQPDGSRRWTTWTEVAEDENDFEKIGAAFEAATPAVRIGQVGNATGRLMFQGALVNFATQWMADNRHR